MKLKVEEAGLTPLHGCRKCGQDFTSERTFAAHRIGVHAYTFLEGLDLEPPREDGRRCLDSDELLGLGWKERIPGRWVDTLAAKKARQSFSHIALEAATEGLEREEAPSEASEAA
jgi:hypothetical protein